MNRVVRAVLDLLFPPKCTFCHDLLPSSESGICDACALQLMRLSPVERSGEFFETCIAAYPYETPVRESMLRFKFSGRQEYAKIYAPMLAASIRERLAGRYDVIGWVPVSRRRKRKRGYDQAELLARQTAAILGEPVVPVLQKVRHTPAQSTIQGAQRRKANVLGAYRVNEREDLSGRRVLLIDDVVTTGATLSECSRVLRTANVKEVVCAAFAAAGQTKG